MFFSAEDDEQDFMTPGSRLGLFNPYSSNCLTFSSLNQVFFVNSKYKNV